MIRQKYCILLQSTFRMFYAQKHLQPIRQLYSSKQIYAFVILEKNASVVQGSQEVLQGFRSVNLQELRVNKYSQFVTNLRVAMKHVGFVPVRREGSKSFSEMIKIDSKLRPVLKSYQNKLIQRTKQVNLQRLVRVSFPTRK